ncbi:hypothetical protein L1049_010753 [Liquidambar formosana]|uniref:Protein AAR2 homolog n=1 Tax=Liquidambar formosana TaxID=63359 RepID=A0AAP0N659_LIQFO
MDSETALEFVKHGATLLLLDVPLYTLIGIDTQMFSVGPVFKGIKMVPPGPHFVYYSSSSRDGKEFSPMIGFFIDTCPSEVMIRKWDQQEERLVKLSEEEEERYRQAVKSLEFDKQLGPYTLSQYGDWKRLSNYITKSTIERIEPIGGEITVTCESGMVGNETAMEKALSEQLRSSKFSTSVEKSEMRGCYYTSIPRFIKRKGICGQELTSLNLDKSQLLESILIKDYGGAEDLLLGELQFSFIAFMMGQSLEAFLQWKSLVSLLFGCTEAPFHTRTQLFTKFIKVIYYQLKYGFQKDSTDMIGAEKGASALLDDLWFSSDSFLHHLCKDFFSLVQDASFVDGDLLSWTRKFKELLENSLGWDFQQNSAVDGIRFEEGDEVSILQTPCDSVVIASRDGVNSGFCPYLQASRSYARGGRSNYDLFGNGKPGDQEFRKAWEKGMDEESCLWTGSEDESDTDEGRSRLEDEIKKVKQKAKEHSDLIDADDSDELRSIWSGSDEEKTLWTGSEGDDDDDIPTEAHPNESSDTYIDKLFEFEETPKYRTLSELLKDEKEPEELSPGKQARKLAVENALKKLKKGPDGRYTNVWEVMSDLDILIGAFENIVSGPEYAELRQGGPKKLNMQFFKDIQARMRDPNYKYSPELKLKPKSKLVSRKKWQKAQSRRRKAQKR